VLPSRFDTAVAIFTSTLGLGHQRGAVRDLAHALDQRIHAGTSRARIE
jgi:hypothetical protein